MKRWALELCVGSPKWGLYKEFFSKEYMHTCFIMKKKSQNNLVVKIFHYKHILELILDHLANFLVFSGNWDLSIRLPPSKSFKDKVTYWGSSLYNDWREMMKAIRAHIYAGCFKQFKVGWQNMFLSIQQQIHKSVTSGLKCVVH